MFTSLDYMHYEWGNYLVNWQGQFQNKDGNRSIILEVIIDESLLQKHGFYAPNCLIIMIIESIIVIP
jgi:hypothetical protein